MNSQIDHNILCDAADALVKAVHEHPEQAASSAGITIRGFTAEQVKQGTEFAIRLGLLYILPENSEER